MADITMCSDKDCSKKESCYRYNAKINECWQAYFGNSPRKENGDCEFYWKMKKDKGDSLDVLKEEMCEKLLNSNGWE